MNEKENCGLSFAVLKISNRKRKNFCIQDGKESCLICYGTVSTMEHIFLLFDRWQSWTKIKWSIRKIVFYSVKQYKKKKWSNTLHFWRSHELSFLFFCLCYIVFRPSCFIHLHCMSSLLEFFLNICIRKDFLHRILLKKDEFLQLRFHSYCITEQ